MKKDPQQRPMNTKRDPTIATQKSDICQQWHMNTGKGLERPTQERCKYAKETCRYQKRPVDTKRDL